MISLQQMFANIVPVRKKTMRGSSSSILFGLFTTQTKDKTMARTVERRGLMASGKVRFFPVPSL